MKFRFNAYNKNPMHTNVRVSTFNGGNWVTNGVITFTLQEWEFFKKVAESDNVEIVES